MGLRRTKMVSPAAYWAAVHAYATSLQPIIAAAQNRAMDEQANAEVPLLQRLQAVYAHLRQQGVRPTPGIFPQEANASFAFYGQHGALVRLQAALFKQAEAAMAVTVYNRSSPAAKARLSSLRLPHSGTWTRVCRTSAATKLTNLQLSIATKQRLGIHPTNPLPVACPCCDGPAALQDDSTHFLGCPRLARTSLTRQHDAIASHLAAWCNSVKLPAFVEPKVDGQRRRPDVGIVLDGGRSLVDVTVVHPCAPSYIVQQGAMHSALGPLNAREAAKFGKYRRLAAEANAEFFPLAISSFGGFGVSAMRLFAVLRQAVAAMDPVPWSSDPVAELVRDLSVILQRGNTGAAITGCHQAGVLLRQQRPMGQADVAPAAQPPIANGAHMPHPELDDI